MERGKRKREKNIPWQIELINTKDADYEYSEEDDYYDDELEAEYLTVEINPCNNTNHFQLFRQGP